MRRGGPQARRAVPPVDAAAVGGRRPQVLARAPRLPGDRDARREEPVVAGCSPTARAGASPRRRRRFSRQTPSPSRLCTPRKSNPPPAARREARAVEEPRPPRRTRPRAGTAGSRAPQRVHEDDAERRVRLAYVVPSTTLAAHVASNAPPKPDDRAAGPDRSSTAKPARYTSRTASRAERQTTSPARRPAPSSRRRHALSALASALTAWRRRRRRGREVARVRVSPTSGSSRKAAGSARSKSGGNPVRGSQQGRTPNPPAAPIRAKAGEAASGVRDDAEPTHGDGLAAVGPSADAVGLARERVSREAPAPGEAREGGVHLLRAPPPTWNRSAPEGRSHAQRLPSAAPAKTASPAGGRRRPRAPRPRPRR